MALIVFCLLIRQKINLETFSDDCSLVEGSIPELLLLTEERLEVNWLYIDLNSETPTLAALNLFWNRTPRGGLVLFGDFLGELETKSVADLFFADWACVVPPFPTGQVFV